MSIYEIQKYLPADELHGNDATLFDQPDVLHSVTERPGVSRKVTAAQLAAFTAGSAVIAGVIDGKVAEAGAALNVALSDEETARQNADAALRALIDLGHGKGGALTAYDFGVPSAQLTQEELIGYACADIWGVGGEFTFDGENPAASEYAIGGVTHTAGEIFNNTWVRNTYDDENHKWVLTNTPDTDPAVFIWTDVGQDVVMGATDTYAGVAKLFNDYTGGSTEGSVTQAAISAMYGILSDALLTKLNKGGGTMTGLLGAMANPTTAAQMRNISIGTAALTAGSSALATGEVYICYE
jgi:hypothetical protein